LSSLTNFSWGYTSCQKINLILYFSNINNCFSFSYENVKYYVLKSLNLFLKLFSICMMHLSLLYAESITASCAKLVSILVMTSFKRNKIHLWSCYVTEIRTLVWIIVNLERLISISNVGTFNLRIMMLDPLI